MKSAFYGHNSIRARTIVRFQKQLRDFFCKMSKVINLCCVVVFSTVELTAYQYQALHVGTPQLPYEQLCNKNVKIHLVSTVRIGAQCVRPTRFVPNDNGISYTGYNFTGRNAASGQRPGHCLKRCFTD